MPLGRNVLLRNAQPAGHFVRSDTFSSGIANADDVVVLDVDGDGVVTALAHLCHSLPV